MQNDTNNLQQATAASAEVTENDAHKSALLTTNASAPQAAKKSAAPHGVADEASSDATKKTRKEVIRVLKFVGFSASAGVIELLSFTLLNEIVHWSYWPSYLIALALSVLWNFTFNKKFTFKSAANVPKAMFLVFLFYCVFTPLSTLGGDALTNIGWNEYLVLACTMATNMITEFLYCKFVVYRNNIDNAQKHSAEPSDGQSARKTDENVAKESRRYKFSDFRHRR